MIPSPPGARRLFPSMPDMRDEEEDVIPDRPTPKSPAHETIAAAHRIEIQQARDLLRAAVEEASEKWVSAPAVTDALLLEFVELAGRAASPAQIALRLNHLAHELMEAHERAH